MAQGLETNIKIKGTRRGLSITLGDGDWPALLEHLESRLSQAAAFFQGSLVHVGLGRRDLTLSEATELVQLLVRFDIQPVSFQTASPVTAESAQSLGLQVTVPEVAEGSLGARVAALDLSEGVLLRRTLRSGQSVRHPGHVVIVGDVNPGAEIIAGGDVVVWGRLRGMVHAGALGDNGAIVCAMELAPTQLRIGSHIAVAPEDGTEHAIRGEVARVLDGSIVAEPWRGK